MDHSAGILLYRCIDTLQVLLVHPGGPYWQFRDRGWWSIPKGKVEEGEKPFTAALREFSEEMGEPLFRGYDDVESAYLDLGMVRQSKTKNVSVWARERDYDPSELNSNTCEIEYPAGSGKTITIPEIDRAEWFDCQFDSPTRRPAYDMILPGQRRFLMRLTEKLSWRGVLHFEESQ